MLSLRRADHSSRGILPTVVRRVWFRNLKNEGVIARVGPHRHGREKMVVMLLEAILGVGGGMTNYKGVELSGEASVVASHKWQTNNNLICIY